VQQWVHDFAGWKVTRHGKHRLERAVEDYVGMEMRCSHRTAQCPKCGKDTYEPEMAEYLSVVKCPWCGARFKNGKVIKEKIQKG